MMECTCTLSYNLEWQDRKLDHRLKLLEQLKIKSPDNLEKISEFEGEVYRLEKRVLKLKSHGS